MKKVIFFISLLSFFNLCCGSTLEGGRYIWEGNITQDKLDDFKKKLSDKTIVIKEIEFRNSLGAPSSAVRISNELIGLIEKERINTFARGYCFSACAIGLLAGQHSTLLPALNSSPTIVLIHPVRNGKTGEIDYGATDLYIKKFVEKSKGRLNQELFEKIYDTKNSNGGVLIFYEPFLTIYGKYSVFFCVGDEFALPRTCKPIKHVLPKDFDLLLSK